MVFPYGSIPSNRNNRWLARASQAAAPAWHHSNPIVQFSTSKVLKTFIFPDPNFHCTITTFDDHRYPSPNFYTVSLSFCIFWKGSLSEFLFDKIHYTGVGICLWRGGFSGRFLDIYQTHFLLLLFSFSLALISISRRT